jgi:tetratricopeptide (TPR) repeat protein
VLVAPPRLKPYFRQMASDLWSVRAMDIELLPAAEPAEARERPGVEHRGAGTSGSEVGGAIPDADFALAELRRIQSGNLKSYRALASVLTRAMEGLLASGWVSEALEAARQAWERIRTRAQEDPLSSAGVLHALAMAEEAEGDFAAAAEHLEHVVELTHGQTDRQRLFWLDDLGRLAYMRRDLREANRAYEEALSLSRQRRQSQGETPEALRDLSVSLDNVGDIRLARGELSAAAEAYEESLALSRQLREILGDIPQANQDLRYCLTQAAAARQALGNESGAQAAQDEADARARQLG